MTVMLRIQVPTGDRSPAAARRTLEGLQDAIEPEVLSDAQLLVTELVTNSLRHAGLDDRGWVQVSVECRPDRLRVVVDDPGGRFAAPPGARTELVRESGWGLFLLDRIADRWGIERKGRTRVWFELDRVRAGRRDGRVG